METCHKCNRNTSCLHQNPVSEKELYFLIGFIILISQIGYAIFFNQLSSNTYIRLSLISSIEVSIILIYMIVMYIMYDKQYLALFFGCHQKKERSFSKSGITFILCARCTGILVGMFLSIGVFLFEISFIIHLLLMVPLLLDGIVQRFTKYQSNNLTRLLTGMLFAPGFLMIYGYINYFIHFGFSFIATQVLKWFI